MGHRLTHRPDRLSGGEQQRVSIAVAMANHPRLLLADEPTGEVDSEAADQIFKALRDFNREENVTIIIVTHDMHVSARVDRVVGMRDGRTSIEILRDRDGSGATTREQEYAIVDRAGRLQLPQSYMETLGLAERAKVQLREDHIGVYPDDQERLN